MDICVINSREMSQNAIFEDNPNVKKKNHALHYRYLESNIFEIFQTWICLRYPSTLQP